MACSDHLAVTRAHLVAAESMGAAGMPCLTGRNYTVWFLDAPGNSSRVDWLPMLLGSSAKSVLYEHLPSGTGRGSMHRARSCVKLMCQFECPRNSSPCPRMIFWNCSAMRRSHCVSVSDHRSKQIVYGLFTGEVFGRLPIRHDVYGGQ